MYSSEANSLISYGLKPNTPSVLQPLGVGRSYVPLDLQRSQLYDYNRVQYGLRATYPSHLPVPSLAPHHFSDPFSFYFYRHDPRLRMPHEEPKPSHSYIGLIAMAILGVKDKKLVLSDIYQWILDNYPYFRTRGPGWRNSIRHNLSLNDCFIKSGRSANGKGHYWAVHPACVDDFEKGDFRRRRAQRKVRKHLGLEVPDDEDDSPCPSPIISPGTAPELNSEEEIQIDNTDSSITSSDDNIPGSLSSGGHSDKENTSKQEHPVTPINPPIKTPPKKRQFDMESLLAPDNTCASKVEGFSDRDVGLVTSSSGYLNQGDVKQYPSTDREPGEIIAEGKNQLNISDRSLLSTDTNKQTNKCIHIPGLYSAFDNNSKVTWSTLGNYVYPVISVPWPVGVSREPAAEEQVLESVR